VKLLVVVEALSYGVKRAGSNYLMILKGTVPSANEEELYVYISSCLTGKSFSKNDFGPYTFITEE